MLSGCSVLIVDDDRLLARATQRALRRHFPSVRIAHDTTEAESQIARRVPEVVLADFELEEGTTSEAFIRRLAQAHPATRIVLYSASQPERWKALVDEALVCAIIVKPCADPKQLLTAVLAAAGRAISSSAPEESLP
jgi:DNA-binding NarL/FixJ family response regulator